MTNSTALKNREKLDIISSLATLLKSGIPILDAVDSLAEESRGNVKKILLSLKEDLNQGKTVTYSFSKYPKAFDPITTNLLKAAEEAGTLDESLNDLVLNIKKDIDLEDKVKAALLYPLLVFTVFTAVLLLILTFVIPRIATVFLRLKVTLPLPTKILIFISKALLAYKLQFLLGFIVFLLFFTLLFKLKKNFLYKILTSLPVINKIAISLDLARFTRTMYLLLSAGIPITEALEFTKDIVYKKEILQIINKAKASLTAGKKFSTDFKTNNKIIPSLMLKVIESAEKSGTMEKGMKDLSEQFETKVGENLKTATTLIEPVMLVLVGILIGGMMLSIIAPIYSLISQIGTR
ncbi:MAG: hypothetical protein UU23_C0001G0105 [Candidatus Curtissbacteria bacterium GW2011_GWA1_40_9]|uniref:Type II secretion system protein GspF domain-containing protein n=1 Tax=Candidatus Curtissbacteria bacterium GW2011_GWA1_40_9 TaxID=1618408 RepID=A0A0G0TU32_9BACT|nr:MAG: hypothetical protein UU23_C0001G0105 [Candidatus Curtissbacteria bacterium GW2011_GWA1_40_9]